MDSKQKFFLFKQSKYFCAAPWANLYLETNGDIKTCCVGDTVLGNINIEHVSAILNGPKAKQIRQNLVANQPHENCKVCYSVDPTKVEWLRLYYNDLLKKSDIDFDHNDFNLGAVDLRWTNTCNFACIYCAPKYSNKIAAEQEIKVVSARDKDIELVQNFVLAHQDNIQEIYLAGGEPLLMKENISFLSSFNNKDVFLRINTNLSNLHHRNKIFEIIRQYTNILWTISIDNIGSRYEYTRYGADWNEFLENLSVVRSLGPVRFNMVYFVGNAMTIDQDVEFLLDKIPDASFSLVPVIGSQAISSRNLPGHLKAHAVAKLKSLEHRYGPQNIFAHSNITNCLDELSKSTNNNDYNKYFQNIDKLHGTEWTKTFPELCVSEIVT